jgi:hypothetical protein
MIHLVYLICRWSAEILTLSAARQMPWQEVTDTSGLSIQDYNVIFC